MAFNRGDTIALMLNYQVNGVNIGQGDFDDIELQINKDGSSTGIKKLLSKGEIVWESLDYSGGTFTGYVVHLSQDETFALREGESQVQLRVLKRGQVGSSEISDFSLDAVLSNKVL